MAKTSKQAVADKKHAQPNQISIKKVLGRVSPPNKGKATSIASPSPSRAAPSSITATAGDTLHQRHPKIVVLQYKKGFRKSTGTQPQGNQGASGAAPTMSQAVQHPPSASGSDGAAGPNVASNSHEPASSGLLTNLHDILMSGSPIRVQGAVAQACDQLRILRGQFEERQANSNVRKWIQAIENLGNKRQIGRTVLGVIGSTGAGKSSLINALCDEAALVPTSGQMACTSVITHISWNKSTDPQQRYRAEIEFITADEWLAELLVLFGDLFTPDGELSGEYTLADTPAAVAFAKLKAVYPERTRTTALLKACRPELLVEERKVKEVLGEVRHYHHSSCDGFGRKIHKFLAGKDTIVSTGMLGENVHKFMALGKGSAHFHQESSSGAGSLPCRHGMSSTTLCPFYG
jgi:hypothetical protein